MITRRAWMTAAVLAGPAASAALADVAPAVYDEWRIEAGEAILIEVESVSTKPKPDKSVDVEVKARVVAVERSKAGLKKGVKVTIRYENGDAVPDAPLGSSWPPMLAKGDFAPAFLNKAKDQDAYDPAAGWMSFTMSPAR